MSKEIVLSQLQPRNDWSGISYIPPPFTNKGTSPRADRTSNAEDETNLSESKGKKKIVEINVTLEDKRFQEWALEGFEGKL
ncbi:hypothetical protein L6452_02796 [Arctium lappa]|uniref:Uncharacterized protein n=1 Tax=Arctium lappa TaxID=4217 RepID=A0ACB9FKG3_ARCLA|nr:hypothetical protein L6452_02796 [Arctium lappa]